MARSLQIVDVQTSGKGGRVIQFGGKQGLYFKSAADAATYADLDSLPEDLLTVLQRVAVALILRDGIAAYRGKSITLDLSRAALLRVE